MEIHFAPAMKYVIQIATDVRPHDANTSAGAVPPLARALDCGVARHPCLGEQHKFLHGLDHGKERDRTD
jgi:hypothetical protein